MSKHLNSSFQSSDGELLEAIKAILKQRPSDGYRRVHVLLNNQRCEKGWFGFIGATPLYGISLVSLSSR